MKVEFDPNSNMTKKRHLTIIFINVLILSRLCLVHGKYKRKKIKEKSSNIINYFYMFPQSNFT